MIIDANMYWFPEEIFLNNKLLDQFLSEIPAEYGWHGYITEIGGEGKKQIVIEKPKGYPSVNYVQGDYVMEKQLADMDQANVEKAVLKLPCCHEWMSLDMCKVFNDKIYEHCKNSGGRLIPLATVPPYGKTGSLQELERCRNELGMKAVQLSAHYGNRYLDDKQFSNFFEKLNELEMTAYVHHTPVPVEYDSFIEYDNLRRSYGRCVDQGLAIGRELFSGFFTRYPKVKLVHSMLGGGFFAFANMMFPHKSKNKEAVNRFKTENSNIVEQFRNNIFFEMSHAQPWGKAQLECAISVLGADHIIFGTSYPVRKEWLLEGPQFIKGLSASATDKSMILTENAARLYHIA